MNGLKKTSILRTKEGKAFQVREFHDELLLNDKGEIKWRVGYETDDKIPKLNWMIVWAKTKKRAQKLANEKQERVIGVFPSLLSSEPKPGEDIDRPTF